MEPNNIPGQFLSKEHTLIANIYATAKKCHILGLLPNKKECLMKDTTRSNAKAARSSEAAIIAALLAMLGINS